MRRRLHDRIECRVRFWVATSKLGLEVRELQSQLTVGDTHPPHPGERRKPGAIETIVTLVRLVRDAMQIARDRGAGIVDLPKAGQLRMMLVATRTPSKDCLGQ